MKLSVSGIDFSYRSTPILDDVSFGVEPGELLCILGVNGAGKSTLIKCINRILAPQRGTVLVDQAGNTMSEVVIAIKRVTDLMKEVNVSSNEQSANVAQVSGAVIQMDHMTQQNAALVEESAAAAESLKQQAHELVQAVAVFKLAHRG